MLAFSRLQLLAAAVVNDAENAVDVDANDGCVEAVLQVRRQCQLDSAHCLCQQQTNWTFVCVSRSSFYLRLIRIVYTKRTKRKKQRKKRRKKIKEKNQNEIKRK